MSDWTWLCVIEVIGVACIVVAWCSRAPLSRKLLWTPALLVPVVGPLFWGAMFDGAPAREDREMTLPPVSLQELDRLEPSHTHHHGSHGDVT